MSDEREQDAALVARRREWYDTATAYMAAQEMPAIAWGIQWEKDLGETGAWLRTVDHLTAERDQAREQLAKLRAACAGISDGLIRTATHGVENLTKRDWLIQTAQNIRDALESEADHE